MPNPFVIRYYKEVGNHLTIINSEYPFYIRGSNYAFSGVVDLIYEKDGKVKVTIAGLPKSLYEEEGDIDGFEREVINDVANLENVDISDVDLDFIGG